MPKQVVTPIGFEADENGVFLRLSWAYNNQHMANESNPLKVYLDPQNQTPAQMNQKVKDDCATQIQADLVPLSITVSANDIILF